MSDQAKEADSIVPADKAGQLVPSSRQGFGIVLRSVLFCELQPLGRPLVDADFLKMPAFERSIEVLRYNVALCEYRLGSNGWLRAWIFSTLRVLLYLLVPLVMSCILIAFLVPAMAGIAQIFSSFAEACHSLFLACLYLLFTMVIVAGAIAFVAILPALLRRRSAR